MRPIRRAEEPRLSGWRSAVVWFVVVADVIVILLSAQVDPRLPAAYVLVIGVVASFGVVGSIVATRRSRNVIGWIMWTTGTVIAWSTAGVTYATYSLDRLGGALPATVPIAFVSNVAIIPAIATVAIFVPLLFPDGRLPSARWRAAAWLGVVATILPTIALAIAPGIMAGGAKIENPIGIPGVESVGDLLGHVLVVLLASSVVLAIASVAWRYRRGNQLERQQLRWFAYPALVMVASVALGLSDIGPLAESGWLVILGGVALVPIGTGVAILRYRLYDLDRLISRTISYGLVTGLLVGMFLLVNLGLQSILSSLTSGNSLAVAGSTLLAAALFTPLRRRVHAIVDRRFDRARYDGEQTAISFSVRMRNATDLPTVTRDLEGTVRHAIAPSSLGLWLREAKR
jgi:hypothetical protein